MVEGSETETEVLKMAPGPQPVRPPGTSSAEPEHISTSGTTVGSPLEALERDEILRTRSFLALAIVVSMIGCLAAMLIPGSDPLARKIIIASTVFGISSLLFVLYQTKDPVRFRQPATAVGWFVPALCANSAVLFFGVFSPAPTLVILGLYFVGLGKAQRMATAAYITCAVAHAVMGLVVILGGRDLGIVHPDLDLAQQIIIQTLLQLMMATTFVIARMSRRTALVAVGELEQAVRVAAHRQALLLEAREALDRALRAKRGRFSDQKIGDYELGDVLGRGAMGEVYAAVESRSGTPVAVKLLSQTSLANVDHISRFLRELRVASTVVSPHVVRVLDIGENPIPYLVMERLEGATLAEILRERRTLPADEVCELISQVGVGISAAAMAGIVHRDLKPQNVFRDRDTWKVLDFGVARPIDHGDTLTAGQVIGTPSYMAPEQATGGTVEHRTDLYALAAIAYRALTGHPPFAAKEIAETLYRVVHTRPLRPSLLAPELGVEVDLVLAIGMAPRPADRFATAGDLSTAVRDALARKLSPAVRARGHAVVQATGWSKPALK